MFRINEISDILICSRWMICQIIFAAYMVVLAVMDIRRRQLRLLVLLSGFVLVAAGFFCGREIPVILNAAGSGVGIAFMAASRATGEAFGYGDSILIVIMGGFLGFWEILSLLLAAFSLAAVFSAVMLARNRFHRKTAFPFVPFLTAAYIGGVIIGAY